MKNLIYRVVNVFLFSILLTIPVLAQEDAKYNFGSAQQASALTVSPGSIVSTKLYFYNIFGNRITHIKLSAENLPEVWTVAFDPPLHTVTVNISGVLTTIEENLNVVPPSDVFETKPETAPEGIEFITSPIGYVGAKPVVVTFSVPETERLGSSHNITIIGVAEWLGQTGAAAISQSRGFDYTITITGEQFTEEIVEERPAVTTVKPVEFDYSVLIVIVIVLAIAFFVFVKRKPVIKRK